MIQMSLKVHRWEVLERDLEARTAVDSIETRSVLSSECEGWSDHEEGTEVPATVEDREGS